MAEFSKGVRRWWLRVVAFTDGYPRDQTWIYSESGGFEQSPLRADEVHHVVPGQYAELVLGERSNDQVGLPVSRKAHRRMGTTLPFCRHSTFHRDMAEAEIKYRQGDKKAFEKVREKHRRKASMGKRYGGGDEGSDHFYEEIMRAKAVYYVAATGDRKPESGKPKPRKKHWADGLFD